MRRREFITVLGGAAAWPMVARGQQSSIPVIGYLGLTSAEAEAYLLAPFRQGLSEAGFDEGRNGLRRADQSQSRIAWMDAARSRAHGKRLRFHGQPDRTHWRVSGLATIEATLKAKGIVFIYVGTPGVRVRRKRKK